MLINNNKKNILIVFGGVSSEHDVSCVSASFIIDNINKEEYNVFNMGITRNGIWWIYNGNTEKIKSGEWENDTDNLFAAVLSPCPAHHGIILFDKPNKKYDILRIDCVFPVLHGKNGEDGTLQGLLTLAGIPFVGCDTYSSSVTMDKIAAKILCENIGIKTVPFKYYKYSPSFDIDSLINEIETTFEYPVFVKPSNAGSSVGITKVKSRSELIDAVNLAFEHDKKILIEKAMTAKEIEAAVIGNYSPVAVGCGEIAPNAEFYDYSTKYITDTAESFIPARIPESIAEKVCREAEIIYKQLDCTGLSRVDFFVDGENIYFNEINTLPGFTSISMYPKLMLYSGKTASGLIDELINLALEDKNDRHI